MKAFWYGLPIGTLASLIGLGGAEFRLPVLIGRFGYKATDAVPINLVVSLVTVTAGLVSRFPAISLDSLSSLIGLLTILAVASMAGAYVGSTWLSRLHESKVERVVMVLLAMIGGILISESFYEFAPGRLFDGVLQNLIVELVCGFGIGVISSMLGIAGGELIIPTLVLLFGVGIKEAGTASLFISLPTVLVGCVRYLRTGSYRRREDVETVILPMGLGSVVGALIGGGLARIVAAEFLKLLLGIVLIVSAVRMFRTAEVVPGQAPVMPVSNNRK